MNINFGRVYNHQIQYAKDYIVLSDGSVVSRPTEEQYLAANQFRVIDKKPVREGYYYTHKDWVEDVEAKTATHLYEEHQSVPEKKVRHFSKLRLYVTLTKLGIPDEQFMTWLATKEVEVEGALIRGDLAFNKAQDLSDDNPMFSEIVKDAQKNFGIGDKELAAILKAIEYDPKEV